MFNAMYVRRVYVHNINTVTQWLKDLIIKSQILLQLTLMAFMSIHVVCIVTPPSFWHIHITDHDVN